MHAQGNKISEKTREDLKFSSQADLKQRHTWTTLKKKKEQILGKGNNLVPELPHYEIQMSSFQQQKITNIQKQTNKHSSHLKEQNKLPWTVSEEPQTSDLLEKH